MLMLKRQIQALLEKGAHTKAIGAAAENARRNPECAASHHLLAMTEEAAGYTKAALQTISHAVKLAPDEPAIRIMRARLLLRDHRLREAVADVDTIIATSHARCDTRFLQEALACRDELLARMAAAARPGKTRTMPGATIRLT